MKEPDPSRGLREVVTQNWVPAMIASAGTVLAAVIAVVLTQVLDDDGNAQQVQPPAITAAPGETSGPTGGAAETLTPPPNETEPPVPDNAIVSAPWNFTYTVTFNECPFGLEPGELVTANLTFREAAADDGYIEDLESASIYAPDGAHVGDYVFHWPTWEFESPIEGGGEVHISLTFQDARNALGTREEIYEDGFGGTCRIVMQN